MTATLPASLGVLDEAGFSRLFEVLRARGYRIVGPTVDAGAIVLSEIRSAGDLPRGWTDEQKPGSYRLTRRTDAAFFGFAAGPRSWKAFLYPPHVRLWRATKAGAGFQLDEEEVDETPPLAFLGVRACEIAAIAVQDRIFSGRDPVYTARRQSLFIVAVNCSEAGGTCFCASMGTGPRVTGGFDLLLTEMIRDERHVFLVESGSEKGAQVLADLPWEPAAPDDLAEGGRVADRALARMGRQLDTAGLKELLYQSYDHPRWNDVAARCLACANCTLVCPTCFCGTVEDSSDLTGEHVERRRSWDSCFSLDFTRMAGGHARPSVRARYRQWLIHKLAAWIDQFGTSGCVGCGRCITWCPAGIDITEEASAIRMNRAERSLREAVAMPGPVVEAST